MCAVWIFAPMPTRQLTSGTFGLAQLPFADRDYLVYENERLTYAQTHQRVAALANWLIAQGVKLGDRVAIAMRNYPEWMQAYWATMFVGAAVVGMNAWWIGPEMLYALQDSTPKVMILDKERLDQLGEHRAEVSDVALVGVRFPEAEAGVTPWDDVVAGDSPLPMLDIDTDSDARIFYTSGTTGRPKGAQLTHRGCVSNIFSMLFSAGLQRLLAIQKGLVNADDEPPVGCSLVTTPCFMSPPTIAPHTAPHLAAAS